MCNLNTGNNVIEAMANVAVKVYPARGRDLHVHAGMNTESFLTWNAFATAREFHVGIYI